MFSTVFMIILSFNPFPHTTILQQTTLNIFCQQIENLSNWMDNLWQKVENIVAKGEIAHFVQFILLSLCFQNAVCCSGIRKRLYFVCCVSVVCGKGLRKNFWKTNVLLLNRVQKILAKGQVAHYDQIHHNVFKLPLLYMRENMWESAYRDIVDKKQSLTLSVKKKLSEATEFWKHCGQRWNCSWWINN